jgi:hypothetical protein
VLVPTLNRIQKRHFREELPEAKRVSLRTDVLIALVFKLAPAMGEDCATEKFHKQMITFVKGA